VTSPGRLEFNDTVGCLDFKVYWRVEEGKDFQLLPKSSVLLSTDEFDLQLNFPDLKIKMSKCQVKELHYKQQGNDWRTKTPPPPVPEKGKKGKDQGKNNPPGKKNGDPTFLDSKSPKGDLKNGSIDQIRHDLEQLRCQRERLRAVDGENLVNFPPGYQRIPGNPLQTGSNSDSDPKSSQENGKNGETLTSGKASRMISEVESPDRIRHSESHQHHQSGGRSEPKEIRNTYYPHTQPFYEEPIYPEPIYAQPKQPVNPANGERMDPSFCPICYDENITYKATVVPCGHIFCIGCLEAWTNQTNRCPLCKRKYPQINVFKDNQLIKTLQVPDKELVFEEHENSADRILQQLDDNCYVCNSGEPEDLLVICDSCEIKCCHTFCTDPPMVSVPEGDWYCDYCVREFHLMPSFPIAQIFRPRRLRKLNGAN
jgi:hypothetical protein